MGGWRTSVRFWMTGMSRRTSWLPSECPPGLDERWLRQLSAGSTRQARPRSRLARSSCRRAAARPERDQRITNWTPAVLAVAEAILCGTRPTVAGARETTGLSSGSCTNALRFLTDEELLTADAQRGRDSGRRIADFNILLRAYASAVAAAGPPLAVHVGVTWRDPVSGLAKVAERWNTQGRAWACTGAVAASLLAPHLTSIGGTDVYVESDTITGLEALAREAGLEPIEGGRLTLRSFPTVTSHRLSTREHGLNIAPWPRVYADLRLIGVRGEEAAEHLLEVMHAG